LPNGSSELPSLSLRLSCNFLLSRFVWRTIHPSACEGSMLHEGEESSSRKLVRVEGRSFEGWGCSECAWVFNPSGPPVGKSLDEMTRNFQMQLAKEFASHACTEHRRAKVAKCSA
jgi:hypothetical protein